MFSVPWCLQFDSTNDASTLREAALVKITHPAGITIGVLAFTMACASGQTAASDAQQSSPAPSAASASSSPATAGGIPRSVLEKYQGEYQLTPQVTATVRLKGETLVREVMGQQTAFIPITATRFKLGGGEVEFVTDPSGAVTMVVRNGGQEKRYPRKGKV